MKSNQILGIISLSFICIFLSFSTAHAARIAVLNSLTHHHHTTPGSNLKGQIDIKNYDQTDHYVRIYQTDYYFDHLGKVEYSEPGLRDRSNASWIELSSNFTLVPAGDVLEYQYQINLPNDSLYGSYWSIIMVESADAPDTTEQTGMVNIQSVIRYGIQIVTTIENTGKAQLEFIGMDLVEKDSSRYVQVDLMNKGDIFLQPFLQLKLFDQEGNVGGNIQSTNRKIYPGTSVRIHLDLEGIKPGNYQALLVADGGDEHVFGINLELEI